MPIDVVRVNVEMAVIDVAVEEDLQDALAVVACEPICFLLREPLGWSRGADAKNSGIAPFRPSTRGHLSAEAEFHCGRCCHGHAPPSQRIDRQLAPLSALSLRGEMFGIKGGAKRDARRSESRLSWSGQKAGPARRTDLITLAGFEDRLFDGQAQALPAYR